MYAIVKTGGKQYNVKAGDVLDVEKLEGNEGDVVELQALLLRDGKETITDAEKLASIKIRAQIIEQYKGDKVLVFKFKKRKGYKRTRGHRQQLTKICIVELNGEKASAPKKGEKPAKSDSKAEKTVDKKADKKAAKSTASSKEDKKDDVKKSTTAKSDDADLSKMTVAELKDLAKERGVKLPAGARKAEIIEAIEKA